MLNICRTFSPWTTLLSTLFTEPWRQWALTDATPSGTRTPGPSSRPASPVSSPSPSAPSTRTARSLPTPSATTGARATSSTTRRRKTSSFYDPALTISSRGQSSWCCRDRLIDLCCIQFCENWSSHCLTICSYLNPDSHLYVLFQLISLIFFVIFRQCKNYKIFYLVRDERSKLTFLLYDSFTGGKLCH